MSCWALGQNKALRNAFKDILRKSACKEDDHFQRLIAVGLVVGADRTAAKPRCDLYARYFPKHL